MNDVIIQDEIKIENLIYKKRGKQVILNYEISRTKCQNYFYDMMVTHSDIGELISVFEDYVII